jgi:CRP-like cAMP-binding protein
MNHSSDIGRVNVRRLGFAGLMAIVLAAGTVNYAAVMDWLVSAYQSEITLLSNLDVGLRAVGILALAWTVRQVLDEVVISGLVERRLRRRIPDIMRGVITTTLYGAGVFAILVVVLGVSPLIVLGVTAGALILLGAPLRGVIEDTVAGTSLSLDPNFSIGMVIETAGGQVGRVVNMGIVRVRLQRPDGSITVIRNSALNHGGYTLRALVDAPAQQSIAIPVPHDIPGERVTRLLIGAALATPGVSHQLEPEVLIEEITETALRYRLIFGVDDIVQAERVRSQLARTLLKHVARAGLSLAPMPTQYVPIVSSTDRTAIDVNVIFRLMELFAVLTEEERSVLARSAKPLELARDAVVCQQGQPGDSLFIVVEGVLEVSVSGPTGDRIVLARIEPGNYVGEMSLMTGAPRSADVVARSPAYVLEVTSEYVKPIIESRPELADAIAVVMVQRQRALEQATSATSGPRTSDLRALVNQIANRIKVFFSIRKTA